MKRTLCVLLALCMLFALLPCSAFAETKVTENVLGVKEGTTYTNAFFSMQAAFPSSWRVLTDEEVGEMMGYVLDTIDMEEVDALLEQNGGICDLMIVSQDGSGDNVNIQIEKLPVPGGLTTSEEQLMKNSASLLESSLKNMGVDLVEMELLTCEFAGKDHAGLDVTMTAGGVTYYERVVIVKVGSYVATITAFSPSHSRLLDMMALFEEIK